MSYHSPEIHMDDIPNHGHENIKEPLVSASGSSSKYYTSEGPKYRNTDAEILPRTPRTLRKKTSSIVYTVGIDVVLLLASFTFLIFALIVLGYHGRAVEEYGEATHHLQNAARIGPSVFPILFAAVVGRLLSGLMAWALERGARLRVLDLLARSTTVANTIFTQISSGMPTLVGLMLIVAWAFSPLGGQASLRVIGFRDSSNSTTIPVQYMSSNYTYGQYATGDLGVLATLINGLFNAALLGPPQVKNSPVDTWNNVKIPMLESLTDDTDALLNSTWIAVPDEAVVYTSLVGLPISSLPGSLNNTLFVETSYITLDCPLLGGDFLPSGSNISNWQNATDTFGSYLLSNATGSALGPDCRGSPNNGTLQPRFIAYDSWNENTTEARFGAICSMQTTYAEVEVTCIGSSCKAVKIRNSTLEHPVRSWTYFDGQESGVDCRWWYYFSNMFINSVSVKSSATATPLQGYLTTPDSPASPLINDLVSDMDPSLFAVRLGQLFNTFLLICAGPYAVPYGFAGDTSGPGLTPATQVNTTAVSIRTFPIIVCDYAWLAILLVGSLILIAASIVTIVLYFKRLTPELALDWSTVVRDSPWVPSADTGSSLDDSERSRLMGDTRLIFGDVAPGRQIGHLAISAMDSRHDVARPRKGRLYI